MASQALSTAYFTFEVEGCPTEFGISSFEGEESISDFFRFDLSLTATDEDVDFDSVFNCPARLTLHFETSITVFEGVLACFEQLDGTDYVMNYHAVLVPKLWLLTLSKHNRIFQNKTVPQIVLEVLRLNGFKSTEYDVSGVRKKYPQREYVVQYQETDFNFASRLLEHEGILYVFSQADPKKILFLDASQQLEPIPGDPELSYRPPTNQVATSESVYEISMRQNMLPKEYLLQDYNWRRPSLDLNQKTDVAPNGAGIVMEYGDHYRDKNEARHLARMRKQELAWQKRVMDGRGTSPRFRAGSLFTMRDHFRFDGEYLLTEVQHHGTQGGSGFASTASGQRPGVEYGNRFSAIPSSIPYRPLRKAVKPRLYGAMNAKVDAAGDGQYAELDDQGRYKLIMPFDTSGLNGGKATRYVRMAQPYAGEEYGMHFPLHKGAEVIWTCIDGDIDRPIITGAVPNPSNASPVTEQVQTKAIVRDHSANEILLEGARGEEQIQLRSPTKNSCVTIGHGPSDGVNIYTEGAVVLHSGSDQVYIEAANQITLKVGDSVLYMDKEGNIRLEGKHITINGPDMVDINPG
ncbi:MAG: type VI secretion system tip protein VgrG [Acidobacteriaceae bacterium]|nr:type VI secretion system tip protein VgrG [Acidobacteriaceae bacterium]MBV9296412.1 type VI secretion system tip protein VgrG [Acidobacteriaceae bacterium]MBV9764376.1 type VI secretion system tip protein VgrG [Acidobacteriaceae bacterium]